MTVRDVWLYTPDHAARITSVSAATLRRALAQGQLANHGTVTRVLFHGLDLMRWQEDRDQRKETA